MLAMRLDLLFTIREFPVNMDEFQPVRTSKYFTRLCFHPCLVIRNRLLVKGGRGVTSPSSPPILLVVYFLTPPPLPTKA